MTTRGPDKEHDEEVAALVRLWETPDFVVYLTVLRRHVEQLRRALHKVLVDEQAIADHNWRTGQIDGLTLASRLPELIVRARTKTEPPDAGRA